MATSPLKELFSQQTGCAVQDVPLMPTPVMGEQLKPTRASTLLTTIPRRPSSVAAAGEDADWTELQHCWLLTLHWDAASVAVAVVVTVMVFVVAGVVVGEPHGVATARMGTSARTAALLNNIICWRERLSW